MQHLWQQEEQQTQMANYVAFESAMTIADSIQPGAGDIINSAYGMWKWGESPDQGMIGSSLKDILSSTKTLVKNVNGDDVTDEVFTAAVNKLVSSSLTMSGVPAGGLIDIAEMAAGASGNPIVQAPKESKGEVPDIIDMRGGRKSGLPTSRRSLLPNQRR